MLAVLVDSKIAGFPLTGAAAMLMRWGDDPVFVLAFGGVNKRYESRLPDGFPKLERLSVPLTRGNNPKLRLECYVAMTSNSFQIGGKLELAASAGKFSIEGFLAIDALIQSGQPCLILDLDAKLQLKAYGVNLFAVRVDGHPQRHGPVAHQGQGDLRDLDLRLLGLGRPHVRLAEHRSTCAAVGRRASAGAGGAARPAQLAGRVRRAAGQSAVTLRTPRPIPAWCSIRSGRCASVSGSCRSAWTIARSAMRGPSGPNRFDITSVTVGGTPVTPPTGAASASARAQFFDMTDDQKLAAPAFEAMPAGVEIGAQGLTHGPTVAASAAYETLIYDAPSGTTAPGDTYALTAAQVVTFSRAAAAHGPGTASTPLPASVAVAGPRYVVASTDDLTLARRAGYRRRRDRLVYGSARRYARGGGPRPRADAGNCRYWPGRTAGA